MWPEYRTRGSSFDCFGKLLPFHFPESRIPSSSFHERRKVRPLKDFPLCLLSLGLLWLFRHPSSLEKGILDSWRDSWGMAEHRGFYVVCSPSQLDSSFQHPFHSPWRTASGMTCSPLRGSLAPCFNSLDCPKVLNRTLSHENFLLWLAPKKSDPASTSIQCVAANLTGDSTCLKSHVLKVPWGSLVVQWLRLCLPMQGTRVRALVWEDPTCRVATGPESHNY